MRYAQEVDGGPVSGVRAKLLLRSNWTFLVTQAVGPLSAGIGETNDER